MISNRLPTNPKAGDTWSEAPIAWWRRGLIYVAESALRTAGENFRADSIQADRLRHQLVFTFDADHACWRAPLRRTGILHCRRSGVWLELGMAPPVSFRICSRRCSTANAN